jgi:4-hydroxy-3-methylbut-2-enyl diphosphate reductase
MKKNKYKVNTAKSAGFCFGVRRAIQLAEQTALKNGSAFTLGPLIHNPQEVKRLAEQKIRVVNTPWRLRNETLIIRTHGVPESVRDKLSKTSLKLVDATCPFVKRAQDIVRQLVKDRCDVVIVGDKTHPEVVGLISYAGKKGHVLEKPGDVARLRLSENVGILSQTTQSPENFKKIIDRIKILRPRAKVFNTICKATMARQSDAKKIARNSDVMIIVGGKNSGNTKRLYEISKQYARSYHIEHADEIKPEWFRKAARIGLTAGASTPDWIISEVENKILNIKELQ